MMNKKVTLYIGTCFGSGYKYFGKSLLYHTKEDLQKYYWGSGLNWKKHYNEFGGEVEMEIYWTGLEYEVEEIALDFSRKNNIVSSVYWLNMQPENGLDGGQMTEEIKRKISKTLKGRPLEKKRKDKIIKRNKETPPMLGKKHSIKSINKMKKSKINISKETRDNMSKGQTGRKHSNKTKKKMRESNKGEGNPMFGKTQRLVTCPHCKRSGAINGMVRWHFINCKLNDSFWEEW